MNKPADYTGPGNTQYAWAWIDNGPGVTAHEEPVSADMIHDNGSFDNMKKWQDGEAYGRPFLSGRPRIHFQIQRRSDQITVVAGGTALQDVWIPECAWNFNETNFEPLNPEPAWLVSSDQVNENFIHAILLNDTGGYGTMNLRRKGFESALTNR